MRVGARFKLVSLASIGAAVVLLYAASASRVHQDPGVFLADFRTNVWHASGAILDGENPLRAPAGPKASGTVYPPITPTLLVPFSLPPYAIAAAFWLIALAGCVVGALRVVGVSDWRVYLAALVSPPVVSGLAWGNVSLALLLAVACAWRFRQHRERLGVVVGLAIAVKIFLWPLVGWLLITRRHRSAVVAFIATVGLTAAGWVVIGFPSVRAYLELSRVNTETWYAVGVSVAAAAGQLGASAWVAVTVGAVCGLALLAYCWLASVDDLEVFACALAAAVVASPITWGHYYALLLSPLAVAFPRAGWVWLLPFLLTPQLLFAQSHAGHLIEQLTGALFALGVIAAVHQKITRVEAVAAHDGLCGIASAS
jgi:hypothetical protein